jgi:MFS family permease
MLAGSLLRRHRDFRLLWFGETVSELGTSVSLVALPLVAVLTLHASTFQVAALSAVETVGWPLLGLPVGVWVDRWPRRPVLIVTDVGRGIALATVPIAAALGVLTLVQLYAVALVTGVLSIFFSVAYPAYLPSLIESSELTEGNAALGASGSAAQVTGPALGGVLVQTFGAVYAVLADVVSFGVSSAAVLAIRKGESPPPREGRSMRRELGYGVRFLARHRIMRVLIAAAGTFNLFLTGMQALTVVFLVRTVRVQSATVGLLLAVGSVGGLVGALLAKRLIHRLGDARAMVLAASVGPTSMLLLPLTHRGAGLAFFCVGMFIGTGSVAVFNVIAGTYRAQESAPNILGRVVAANRMVTWGVMPIGAISAGWMAATLGVRTALWILAAGTALTPIWLLLAGIAGSRDLPHARHESTAAGNVESARQ